jgi:hypothetical protein
MENHTQLSCAGALFGSKLQNVKFPRISKQNFLWQVGASSSMLGTSPGSRDAKISETGSWKSRKK